MKKIFYTCLLLIGSIGIVNAASLGVSANKSTVVVGSSVNVTVTASGGAGWEYCLNYDESLFQLTSAGTDTGGKCLKTGSTMTGYSKVTFTLKAKKSGSGTVSLSGAAMYGDDGLAINASKGSVNLVAKTQAEIEASYSTNANLKSLSVKDYEITPGFNKDTLEYSLEVENDIESVVISALRADNTASVSGAGEVTLSEGANVFNIIVTAQKGNKKTYVLTINRKELNPIEVLVDGKKMFVVRKLVDLEVPTYYVSDTEKYEYVEYEEEGDNLIPVFKSEISGYTLVALKDEDGNVAFYIWNKDDNSFRLYQSLNSSNLMIVIEQPDKLIDGFEIKKNYKLNGIDIEIYKDNGNSKYGLVYGMNAATGSKSWYQIDLEEGTYQRYNADLFNNLLNEKNKYKMFCLYAVIGCGLLLFVILILLISRSKLRKKNNKMYAILTNGGHVSHDEEEESIEVEESIDEDEHNEETLETEEVDEIEEEIVEEPKEDKKKKKKEKKEKKEKKSRRSKKKEVVEEEESSDDEEVSEEVEESIDDGEKSPELKELEEEEKQELSKKELKRLEKEKIKKEREELKKMQDEFLN